MMELPCLLSCGSEVTISWRRGSIDEGINAEEWSRISLQRQDLALLGGPSLRDTACFRA
jgi:hypothetical protein